MHRPALIMLAALVSVACTSEGEPNDCAPQDFEREQKKEEGDSKQKGGAPTPPDSPTPYQESEHYGVEWVSKAYCAANPIWVPDSTLNPAHYPNDLDNRCQVGLYVVDQSISSGSRPTIRSTELDATTRTLKIVVGYTSYDTEAKGGAHAGSSFVADAALEVCAEPYTIDIRREPTAWIEYFSELETLRPCD